MIARTTQQRITIRAREDQHLTDTDDLWAQVRGALPDADVFAAEVAAQLDEPLDDVRLSVLIGTVALNGQLGPEAAATAAIEVLLDRLQSAPAAPSGRLLAIDSLEDLLAEALALNVAKSLDLDAIVAIQRASGAAAARTDRPILTVLHRYAVTRRLIWQHCIVAMEAGRLTADLLARFGRFLLLWNELTSLAVTEGYRIVERDILARDAEARRGALQELLGVIADDTASESRLRRVAVRHGLNPDGEYRLVAILPIRASGATADQAGMGDDELEVLAGRVGHLLGSTAPGADGVGAGIRLPSTLPLLGRIAILARGTWAGLRRVPTVLDNVLGVNPDGRGAPESGQSGWLAIGAGGPAGIGALAATYADLVDATRTARRLGFRGWIPDPEQLALERLLLGNQDLADASVRRELGPLLADERFGDELVETLQAYFDAGENVTAAARHLHLATRTVGYRLEKIESLLGHPLAGPAGRRLSAALMLHRLHSVDQPGRA